MLPHIGNSGSSTDRVHIDVTIAVLAVSVLHDFKNVTRHVMTEDDPEIIYSKHSGDYLVDGERLELDFVHFPALRREAQRLCHSDDTVWRDFIAFSVLRGV